MAKTKTWRAIRSGRAPSYLECNDFLIARMVANAGLVIDPHNGYEATETLLDNLVDVLNREIPGGAARKHERSKEKK